jgi:hypothetical protein
MAGGGGQVGPPFQGFGVIWDVEPQGFALGCLGLPRWGEGQGFILKISVGPVSALRDPFGIAPLGGLEASRLFLSGSLHRHRQSALPLVA